MVPLPFDTRRSKSYHWPMSKRILPKQIEPLRLVEKGEKLAGELGLDQMPRLADLILNPSGKVDVALHFTKDMQGLPWIYGKIHTQVEMACQRCLKPVSFDLEIAVNLRPVRSEADAEQLPESMDPLMVGEDPVLLIDMIEDEILLNLPLVAKHEPACIASVSTSEEEAAEKPLNPFATLRSTKFNLLE